MCIACTYAIETFLRVSGQKRNKGNEGVWTVFVDFQIAIWICIWRLKRHENNVIRESDSESCCYLPLLCRWNCRTPALRMSSSVLQVAQVLRRGRTSALWHQASAPRKQIEFARSIKIQGLELIKIMYKRTYRLLYWEVQSAVSTFLLNLNLRSEMVCHLMIFRESQKARWELTKIRFH